MPKPAKPPQTAEDVLAELSAKSRSLSKTGHAQLLGWKESAKRKVENKAAREAKRNGRSKRGK